jgi:hypothetical protein
MKGRVSLSYSALKFTNVWRNAVNREEIRYAKSNCYALIRDSTRWSCIRQLKRAVAPLTRHVSVTELVFGPYFLFTCVPTLQKVFLLYSLQRCAVLQGPWSVSNKQTNEQTNSVAFSPQANYTNWATATCRQNLVPTIADRGVLCGHSGGSLTAVNLSFLDWSRYFSFK